MEATNGMNNIKTCVYVIKTFEYNHTTKAIDYAGLWEDEYGNKEFKTEEEARKQFEYATEGDKGYIAVELVEIDPDSEIREDVIEEWEDNISEYVTDDDLENEEIDFVEPELVEGKLKLKKV